MWGVLGKPLKGAIRRCMGWGGPEPFFFFLKSPRREVVRSSAGAGVVYPPFWGVIRVAYPKP